jgi:alpha-glucosidase
MKILKVLILIILLFPFASKGNREVPLFAGNMKSFKQIGHGVEISSENSAFQILCYSPEIIRVRITSSGTFEPDFSYAVIQTPSGKFSSLRDTKDSLILFTDSLRVIVIKQPLRIKFQNLNGVTLSEDYSEINTSWLGTEVTCYKKLFPDEKFIGLGEKNGPLNRRGNAYENWNTDIPSYSEKEDPLYQSIPFFIGIHDHLPYGIFLDNSYRTRFNFGASTDDQFSFFSAVRGEMNYYFFGASSVAAIIKDYTWLTGRMKLPPLWSLGYHQSRWGYYPESEFMSVAQKFRDKKIPCDGLWLDINYMDAYKIFTWHPADYSQPKKMLDKLHQMGYHVTTIVDPGIKIEKGYFAYDEGVGNDYFIKYPNGKFYIGSVWPGRCHFPDFTKESVRKWWGSSFKYLIEPGIDGFWNDMNEPAAWGQNIPDILQFDFDGYKSTMAEAHNIYGLEMSRATFEGTKQLLNGRRPFILTRAGFSGIQRYSAVWTGDNTATEKDILMGVRLVNSMGLSGIAFTGVDIGGFMGSPSKELFIRWLSVGVYTPFFRNHTEIGSLDQEPWAFGEEFEGIAKKMIEFRYRLIPYIYSVFYEASLTGMPVARSLAINYTYDSRIYEWNFQNQYLFGPGILVAPLTSEQRFCKVYLPEGKWYRLGSDKSYDGPAEVIVNAPIWDLPVFAKESAIIPMQSLVQNTTEKPSPVLEIHIFIGSQKNSFTYYEDDGETYNYEQGDYYLRVISFDPITRTISFAKTEGSFKSKFTSVNLVLHDFGDVRGIKVNGQEQTLNVKSEKERMAEFPLKDEMIEIKY